MVDDNTTVRLTETYNNWTLECLQEGTVTVTATQEGNDLYYPAPAVSKTVTIVTTSITPHPMDARDADAPIYDLQGRRVLHPTVPGIYIISGRKVMLR